MQQRLVMWQSERVLYLLRKASSPVLILSTIIGERCITKNLLIDLLQENVEVPIMYITGLLSSAIVSPAS